MVGRAVDGQRVFSLHVFFDIFDRCADVQLTGLSGSFWASLGCLQSVFVLISGLQAISGISGASAGGLGLSSCLCRRSRAFLGALF